MLDCRMDQLPECGRGIHIQKLFAIHSATRSFSSEMDTPNYACLPSHTILCVFHGYGVNWVLRNHRCKRFRLLAKSSPSLPTSLHVTRSTSGARDAVSGEQNGSPHNANTYPEDLYMQIRLLCDACGSTCADVRRPWV
jgi:hypothetical protein